MARKETPKQFQKKFIKDLLGSVMKDMLAKVDEGKVPEEWKGMELREWIKDRVRYSAGTTRMTVKEERAYANACLNGNL